ncbi:MAG: DNA primase, partial [Candidatus Aenigmatarchaeota archaeon]
DIIIVEGRADVVNLLKFGIRNTIAIEGTSIPPAISNIVKEKVATLFVDGDRGGQLISKELLQKAPGIDFIASAPEGKEVEELTKKEVFKALRDKSPADQFMSRISKDSTRSSGSSRYKPRDSRDRRERPSGRYGRRDSRRSSSRDERPPRATVKQKESFKKTLDSLVGTRAACILDENGEVLGKVPVTELESTVKTLDNPHAIVLDGKVDSNLNYVAKKKGVKYLVGTDKEEIRTSVCIMDKNDLGK